MRITMATVAASLLGSALSAAAQVEAQPSAYELEVWRAATKLDVKEAYEGYINRFPKGGFADMARLHLRRFDSLQTIDAEKMRAAKQQSAPTTLDPSKIRGNGSGMISTLPGDRVVGPRAIAIGGIGAQRQLILPPD